MLTISTTPKALVEAPKDLTHIILTEGTTHRFVETTAGVTEFHYGVGKYEEVTVRRFRTILRSLVQAAKGHQIEQLAIELPQTQFPKLAEQ